jgi:hypothetical protein
VGHLQSGIDRLLRRKPTNSLPGRKTIIEGAGTSLKAALDILRRYGAVPETLLPFHIQTNMYLGDENVFYATAATRKIARGAIGSAGNVTFDFRAKKAGGSETALKYATSSRFRGARGQSPTL